MQIATRPRRHRGRAPRDPEARRDEGTRFQTARRARGRPRDAARPTPTTQHLTRTRTMKALENTGGRRGRDPDQRTAHAEVCPFAASSHPSRESREANAPSARPISTKKARTPSTTRSGTTRSSHFTQGRRDEGQPRRRRPLLDGLRAEQIGNAAAEALQTIDALKKTYPKSQWIDDANALEVEVRRARGERVASRARRRRRAEGDRHQLADAHRSGEGLSRCCEKIVSGPSSKKIKERALFILSQSSLAERAGADRRHRQRQGQPRAAEATP